MRVVGIAGQSRELLAVGGWRGGQARIRQMVCLMHLVVSLVELWRNSLAEQHARRRGMWSWSSSYRGIFLLPRAVSLQLPPPDKGGTRIQQPPCREILGTSSSHIHSHVTFIAVRYGPMQNKNPQNSRLLISSLFLTTRPLDSAVHHLAHTWERHSATP